MDVDGHPATPVNLQRLPQKICIRRISEAGNFGAGLCQA